MVSPTQADVRVGENYPFTATAYDASGSPCDNVTFTWSSSNPGAATIDANGIAHGVASGLAEIRARTGAGPTLKTGTAALTVQAAVETQAANATALSSIPGYAPVMGRPTGPGYAAYDRQPEGNGPAEGLAVDPLTLVLVPREWRALDFRAVRGVESATAQRVPIIFAVEAGGERVVSVDSLGIVTSLGEPGTAIVRLVVPNNPRISAKLVRVEVRADSLRFNRTRFSMAPGVTETLSVYIPAQNRPLNNPELFEFFSSDTTVLRVSRVAPIIRGVGPGTARVVARSPVYPEITGTISVHRPVEAIRIQPTDSTRTLAIGARTVLRVAPLAADSSPVPEAPISWSAPDSTIVRVQAAGDSAVIRGLRAGTATVMVTVSSSGERAVTRLVRIRVVAGGLGVARTRFGMGIGERQPLVVDLLDDAGTSVGPANSYLAWTVAPDSVLRIDNGNEIVALKPGRARVTGRATSWDSTVTLDVFVVGDLLMAGTYQGRRDLLMKWNGGQSLTPLTADSAYELQSAWSPDLTRLVYTARPMTLPAGRRNFPERLYLLRPDGTGRVQLLDDTSVVRYPSFVSATRLIWDWNANNRNPQVWTGELRGDSLVNVTQVTTAVQAPNTMPAAMRDGSRIAYVSLRETSPGTRPVYAIYQAGLDGGNERLKVQAPSGQRVEAPAYSPDGRWLYFLRSEGSGRTAGKRVWRIPAEASPDTAAPVTPAGIFVNAFSLNGDGSVLALATLETGPNQNVQVPHVMLFPVATGQGQVIDASAEERPENPSFRPATPRPAATPGR